MRKVNAPFVSLQLWVFIVAFLALVSWPLENAIALRNISLIAGSLACLSLIILDIRVGLKPRLLNCANGALLLVMVWALLRYFFFSDFPTIEKGELTSLWMRSFLALISGTSLGYLCTKSDKWAITTLICMVIIFLSEYYLGFLSIEELEHPFFDGLFKSKAAVSYFLLFPYLISCGCIHFALSKSTSTKFTFPAALLLGLSITVIGLSLFGFYFSKSLNGLLVATLCIFPLLIKLLTGMLRQKQRRGIKLLIVAILISSILGFLSFYSKYDSKLTNIISDAYLGTQIDLYPNWHNDINEPWVPIAPDGHQVNQSTYYRVANMLNGIRFVAEHPLGVGYTWLPYGYLMKQQNPQSQADHTHSGWVDFALGQGVPGLLLLWSAVLGAFVLGIKTIKDTAPQSSPKILWGYVTVWVMGGIFVAWIVNEVSEREYIEQLFFIISLFAAGNTPP
jgi:hypothetical protein